MSRTPSAKNWFIGIATGLYLLLSLVYLWVIPAGESPDEPGHVQCIEQVANEGRLPVVEPEPQGEIWWSRGRIISGRMCYHMPLYYLLAGGSQRLLAAGDSDLLHFEFPPSNPDFGAAPAMFLHEEKSSPWQLSQPVTLLGLRLLSIALGGLLLWATYRVARCLFPGQEAVAAMAMVMVGGWPQVVYLNRAINNDVLATGLAVSILVVLLGIGHPERFVAAALLSALAILTKLTVLFTAVVVVGTWLFEFIILQQQKRRYLRAALLSVLIWGAVLLLIAWHPILRQHWDQSGAAGMVIPARVRTLAYWQDVFVLTLSSGWVRFGWMNVAAPQWHAYVWWAGVALAALVGVYAVWQNRFLKHRLLLSITLLLWLAGVALSYIRINISLFQPQFRFALAAVPLLVTFSAAGYLFLLKRHPFWRWGSIVILSFILLGYNLWLVLAVIKPAYY